MKQLEFKNRYWKKDPKSYLKLWQLVHQFPRNYVQMLLGKASKHSTLLNFINACVSDVIRGMKLSLKTKIFFIFNDLDDFPLCHECMKPIIKQALSCFNGFKHHSSQHFLFCSSQCKHKSKDFAKIISQKQTSDLANPEVKAAKLAKTKRTLIERHNDVHFPQKQSMKAMLEKHGVKSTFSLECTRKKCKETLMSKYGVDNPFAAREVQQKIKVTMMRRHGVDHPSKIPATRTKAYQTSLKRHGTYACSYKYVYDGKSFDSSWELCYYIWLVDNKKSFTYPSGISLRYEFKGKVHHYHPDFIVEGKLVEIKGKQYLNEDGNLTLPYKNVKNRAELEQAKAIAKCKSKCMKDHDVVIIGKDEIQPFLKHVEQKHQVRSYLDFCKQFRSRSKQSS